MLTKTTYLAYIHCPKHFWLDEYQPALATAPNLGALRRLRAGLEVDKLARHQFPQGVHIPYRPQPKDMTPLTMQAIAAGAETLFQATFAPADLLVKVDILTKIANGWHLIEVKSSTKYKADEHLPDVAFQVYVLQQAHIDVTQVSLMHLNSDCRYPDLTNLFALTDVTEAAQVNLAQVAIDVVTMRQIIAQTETMPNVGIGRHCVKPAECPFYAHCWQGIARQTIYEIPYLKRPLEAQLKADGIQYVSDIPAGFSLKDKRATAFVETIQQQQIVIDHHAIQAEMAALTYPLYFFDFETIDYPIPTFANCKPYQQVPFQYSCHILKEDGTLTHHDYLHTDTEDPRRPLTESLLNDIGDTGSIIVYFATFERGRLRELAELFPEYAPRLMAMVDRLWDQLDIFKKYYRDHRFGGSNSLKSVLPVIVPTLSYKLLEVQNGTQAQVVWEAMIGEGETAVKQNLIQQLRAYCHLDTLAMVEIHHVLKNL
ncbi:MAG: hypothetical protein DHS20C20_28390 [Ardenticatenaceae bacterium]|nr:MAG: hypothetical protein DHS20C20_28390 [Ardenticatenaceae bacterium]